jgi:hypothetical protein
LGSDAITAWRAGLSDRERGRLTTAQSNVKRWAQVEQQSLKKRPRCYSGPLGVQFQGSSDGVNWTVLYSTTTVGGAGEIVTSVSSNLMTGNFQQHRFAIQSQGQPIAVAQAQFNVATTGTNEE